MLYEKASGGPSEEPEVAGGRSELCPSKERTGEEEIATDLSVEGSDGIGIQSSERSNPFLDSCEGDKRREE